MAVHNVHHELAATIVGILGNIISGMVYLAPLPTYYRIYKKKSIEGFQSVPYVVALFSAMLWLYYAVLKKEYFLISINSAGCIIETMYIAFYYAYAPRKAQICTAKVVFALNLGVFSLIVIIIQWIMEDNPNRVHVLGYICAVVSTSVFAAPLTIMVKVIRTESVEFMPFTLSFFLTLCAVSWLAYGLLREDLFISIPNVFGIMLGLLQMVLYLVCKHCCFSKESNSTNKVVENFETVEHPQIDCEQGSDRMADEKNKSIEIRSKLSAFDNAD